MSPMHAPRCVMHHHCQALKYRQRYESESFISSSVNTQLWRYKNINITELSLKNFGLSHIETGDKAVDLHQHCFNITTDIQKVRRIFTIVNTINNSDRLCLSSIADVTKNNSFQLPCVTRSTSQLQNLPERHRHFAVRFRTALHT